MTSSPETAEKIDQNKAFWSAWLVFLLGAPVAPLKIFMAALQTKKMHFKRV